MMNPEQREWRRIDVDIPAQGELLSLSEGAFSSRIVNLNPEGVCFTIPEGVIPGQDVCLTFSLRGEGELSIHLRILWVGRFEKLNEYRAGGKLESVDQKEKDCFQRFYQLKVMTMLGG